MTPLVQLGTIVIGPQAGGRGYRLLATSGLPELNASATAQLNAMPLALAGWADAGEQEFIARIPLEDSVFPALLLRGRLIGQAAGGSIAFANGVVVLEHDAAQLDAPIDTLFSLIPMPDGDLVFAAQAVETQVPLAATQVKHHEWAGLGLGWRDRVLVVPEGLNLETIAFSALTSIDPPEQNARIRGWATTSALQATGPFNPARALQLIVVGRRAALPLGSYAPAAVTLEGFEGDSIAPPPSWRVWQHFQALAGDDPVLRRAVGRLKWAPQTAALAPDVLARSAAQTVIDDLAGAPPELTHFLTRATSATVDPLLVRAVVEAFGHTVATGSLDRAVDLTMLWRNADPALRSVVGDVDARLVQRPDLAGASGQVLDEAINLGLIETILRLDNGRDAIVDGASREWLTAMLGRITELPNWRAAHADVTSRILRRLVDIEATDDPAVAAYFAAGLGRCLDWADVRPVVVNLISRAFVVAVMRSALHLSTAYAGTLLRLRASVAAGDMLQFRIVDTTLAWLAATDARRARDSL